MDLSGVDLSGVDLSGVDLSGVDLSGVDLSGVDLSGVDLSGVDLSGVDISGVDISGVDLSGSNDELNNVITDLKYLLGLGLTPDSGNDTLNDRLKKYKDLTGTDYLSTQQQPESTPDLDSLVNDLKYLFGLGLNPGSGNATLDDRLKKYKDLTGTDYQPN